MVTKQPSRHGDWIPFDGRAPTTAGKRPADCDSEPSRSGAHVLPQSVAAEFGRQLQVRVEIKMDDSANKFDPDRASEYAQQSRIALAGYDACHDLSACLLSAVLGSDSAARILVAGAGGTAQEIVSAAKLAPRWKFTGVDPSESMLQLSRESLVSQGLAARAELKSGYVSDLQITEPFDAATLIGVIHHLNGDNAKRKILDEVATKLKPGAPLVLACNRFAYDTKPLFLTAWGERWRMSGASKEEVEVKRGKILQGADPPTSNEAVLALLDRAGFIDAEQFFSSLFWSAWIARYDPGKSPRS